MTKRLLISDEDFAKLTAASARYGGDIVATWNAAVAALDTGGPTAVRAQDAAIKANTAATIAAAGEEHPEVVDDALARLGPERSSSASGSPSRSTSTTVAPENLKGAITNPLKRWSRNALGTK